MLRAGIYRYLMTKLNNNGGMENHVHNFDYKSVIGRSDGPVIDLESFDRFKTMVSDCCELY